MSMRNLYLAAAALALAGCGPSVIPTEPPAGWMMIAPKPLDDPPKGANYKKLYADLRRDSGQKDRRLRGLQAYVRTLTGK